MRLLRDLKLGENPSSESTRDPASSQAKLFTDPSLGRSVEVKLEPNSPLVSKKQNERLLNCGLSKTIEALQNRKRSSKTSNNFFELFYSVITCAHLNCLHCHTHIFSRDITEMIVGANSSLLGGGGEWFTDIRPTLNAHLNMVRGVGCAMEPESNVVRPRRRVTQ
ncbi:hypothetical protein JRQ81_005957, partial [Phrynocephalus forsythii]